MNLIFAWCAVCLRNKTGCCSLNFALGAVLVACSSAGTPQGISGNWYTTDPSYTPSQAFSISGVGFALVETNGSLSGNVTAYLVSTQLPCVSLAFYLPASGTRDQANYINLTATDGIVSFKFAGNLNAARNSFSNGNYIIAGDEAYPRLLGATPFETPSTSQSSCSATLNGQRLPPLGSYLGTLIADNGAQVDASMSLQQAPTPYTGSRFGPAIIVQGRSYIYPSGFAVNGSITLHNSVCGVTSASIQPKEGFLFGNYLVVEFDTDKTYTTGAAVAFSIDPSSGASTLVPGDLIQE